VEVSIAPSIGNRAYEMKVHGKNILYMPAPDVAQLKQRPGLSGIPFLAPWANRMADGGFWANGKKYTFNSGLGTTRVAPTGIADIGRGFTGTLTRSDISGTWVAQGFTPYPPAHGTFTAHRS